MATLDVIVGVLALAVAAWFLVAWRRIGEPALLLFAAGLALKGVGYALGGSHAFDVQRPADALDLARLVAVVAGTFAMMAAYAQRRVRALLFLGWVLAGLGLAVALADLLVLPAGGVPLAVLSPAVHAVVAVANVGLALYASAGFRESPGVARALVPTAFLLWGLSNYTWLLIDLGAPATFGGAVHLWRVCAVLLMLAALAPPRGAGVVRAEA